MLVIGHVIWTRAVAGGADVPEPLQILAIIAVIFAARLGVSDQYDGGAFAASAIAIARDASPRSSSTSIPT